LRGLLAEALRPWLGGTDFGSQNFEFLESWRRKRRNEIGASMLYCSGTEGSRSAELLAMCVGAGYCLACCLTAESREDSQPVFFPTSFL